MGLGFEGVNVRVARWFGGVLAGELDGQGAGGQEKEDEDESFARRVRGWVMMDFFMDPAGADIVPLLVECNYL